jgi:murein L,D-transpeptidase YafK
MISRRGMLAGSGAMALGLAGCGEPRPRFLAYDGPQVTSLVVFKARRSLHLFHNDTELRGYPIQLGFAPEGHKQFQGDGKTPEGDYWISHRNPQSQFHLSIKISYPNDADRTYARALGRDPGGDIFIHGTPRRHRNTPDWTAGCIAIGNRQMEEVYAMVDPGTMIFLRP